MSKVEILRLDSVTTNDTRATALINTNFHNIQTVIETLLSRTSATPNYMDTVLDMNSQRIINTAMPTEDFDVVNLKYLRDYVGNLETLVSDATEAAQTALAQAQNAAASATSSAAYAQTAQAAATQSAQDAIDAARYAKAAEDAKDLAVAAADTITGIDFAVDLQYADNYLQLIDQHGDALGTAVEITGGGGSGSGTVFIATNISVDELDFEENDTYEQYPYKVTETIAGVTEDMTCLVTLPVNIATSGLIAPVALVGDGEITLWSKEIIEETFVIPTITFFASGDE